MTTEHEDLARLLLKSTEKADVRLVYGLVDSTTTYFTLLLGKVNVYLQGSDFPIAIRFLQSYKPNPGDVVLILKNGPDMVVLDRVASMSATQVLHPPSLLTRAERLALPASDKWIGFTVVESNTGLLEWVWNGTTWVWNGRPEPTNRIQTKETDLGADNDTTGTFTTWPAGNSLTTTVPWWATKVTVQVNIGNLYVVTNDVVVDFDIRYGSTPLTRQIRLRKEVARNGSDNRFELNFSADFTCTPDQGSTADIRTLAQVVSGGCYSS